MRRFMKSFLWGAFIALCIFNILTICTPFILIALYRVNGYDINDMIMNVDAITTDVIQE